MVPAIEVQGLTRSYGQRRGVAELDFRVGEGEIFGFIGPNGAGKTTTIRVLMGLLKPTRGGARIFGHDCWAGSTRVKALVGYLPGEIHLYDQMTGAEFLEFFAAFRPGDGRRRAHDLAERLDLDLTQRVRHLSKGNRQKLAIVQALMHDAPLLILDEPSSGLDPLKQAELLQLLEEEQARGKTIFLSSHILFEVQRLAARVGIIREGRLVAVETIEALERLWERRLTVTLREPVPEGHLTAADGVQVLSVDASGLHLALAVRGGVEPVIRLLGALPVADFTFGPPDLESIFLHYYGPETGAPAASLEAAR